MPKPRLIRCGKCHVVMGVRHFVLVHRRPIGVVCSPVPCAVCEKPVGIQGLTAFGEAVCSVICERNHPEVKAALWKARKAIRQAERDMEDQLDAYRRAAKLPLIYQRRDRLAS